MERKITKLINQMAKDNGITPAQMLADIAKHAEEQEVDTGRPTTYLTTEINGKKETLCLSRGLDREVLYITPLSVKLEWTMELSRERQAALIAAR